MASYTKSTNEINIRQAKIPSQRMKRLIASLFKGGPKGRTEEHNKKRNDGFIEESRFGAGE
ncbi:hypothetical protein CCACVL1_04518 [Corchorus capsularis]|uniref:Uncharacterized protein n=1 Tax=Corchorus capsularis TaxID=210143 RepID=A0A1R3JRS1_COCAP|nr:hypothetical protein CCACVL1_04518 [Corchorus capsularis]